MQIRILVLIAAAVVCSPLRAGETACQGFSDAALIGLWEVNQFNETKGYSQIETFEHFPDGRIVMNIRMFRDDGEEEVVEEGSWFLTNCIYMVTTEKINGKWDPARESYEVLELTPDRFVYRSERSGQVYASTRVQR